MSLTNIPTTEELNAGIVHLTAAIRALQPIALRPNPFTRDYYSGIIKKMERDIKAYKALLTLVAAEPREHEEFVEIILKDMEPKR